jgi:hypothetical protein
MAHKYNHCYVMYFPAFYKLGNEPLFCGEGPRSRRCGRTGALRLIVQAGDEGDQLFPFFTVMEHRWN